MGCGSRRLRVLGLSGSGGDRQDRPRQHGELGLPGRHGHQRGAGDADGATAAVHAERDQVARDAGCGAAPVVRGTATGADGQHATIVAPGGFVAVTAVSRMCAPPQQPHGWGRSSTPAHGTIRGSSHRACAPAWLGAAAIGRTVEIVRSPTPYGAMRVTQHDRHGGGSVTLSLRRSTGTAADLHRIRDRGGFDPRPSRRSPIPARGGVAESQW